MLASACGAWHEWLCVGLLAAGGFGVVALLRLARMAELGGALGKLAAISRHFLFKLGVMHE